MKNLEGATRAATISPRGFRERKGTLNEEIDTIYGRSSRSHLCLLLWHCERGDDTDLGKFFRRWFGQPVIRNFHRHWARYDLW